MVNKDKVKKKTILMDNRMTNLNGILENKLNS